MRANQQVEQETRNIPLPGKYKQVLDAVEVCLNRNEPFGLWGVTGVGKSENLYRLATKRNWKVVEFRVAETESIDLRGRPEIVYTLRYGGELLEVPASFITGIGLERLLDLVVSGDMIAGRTKSIPPDELPIPERDGEEGLFFADEVNLAPGAEDTRAAIFKLIDRKGANKLPPGWRIAFAANPVEHNSLAVELAAPFENRFAHLELPVPTGEEWVEGYAIYNNIIPSITGFHVSAVGAGMLYKYQEGERAFPTPRAWARASRLIAGIEDKTLARNLMAACIGEAATHQYFAYVDFLRDVPSLRECLENPNGVKFPYDRAALWGLVMSLVHGAPQKRAREVFGLLRRIEEEAQAPELVARALHLIVKVWGSFPPEAMQIHGRWLNRYIPYVTSG